jgi:hypothetical protein
MRARKNWIHYFSEISCLFLLIVCSINSAFAEKNLSILLNGKSFHINEPANLNLNENNWGMGLQYDLDPVYENWIPFLMASGFNDSNSNPSYMAGGGIARRMDLSNLYDGLHFDAGLVGFMMTRKGTNGGDPFPGVLPALSIGTERLAVNFTYIPKLSPKHVALWYFQLKVSLDYFR